MKHLLVAIALAVAVLMASGCGITVPTTPSVSVMVSARAELNTTAGDIVSTDTRTFGPYSHYTLSDYELASIFRTLVKNTTVNYTTAFLILEYAGAPQKHEEYGIMAVGGEYYSVLLLAE